MNAYAVAKRQERSVGGRWVAGALAAFALPAGVLLTYFAASLAGLLVWPVLVLVAYLIATRSLEDSFIRTVVIVLVTLLTALLELIIGAGFLSTTSLIVEGVIGLFIGAACSFWFARQW